MAARYMFPVPPIGTVGVYSLLAPFVTQEGESFECVAVRRFSDYEINSEDLWTDVYLPAGLGEEAFNDDKRANMEIITLLSERGYSLQVPARYIDKYPMQDGIPYRRMGVHVALPAMRVGRDLSAFKERIVEAAMNTLGVTVKLGDVEASRIRRYNVDTAELIEAGREINIGSNITPYVRMKELEGQLSDAMQKIQALEEYILANQQP